ncbi:thioredoxin family protein [Psychromonas sp. Urea-02u-13]|uniref:thioredoxin family protein n=1 Tax=Psychromonas sp. Urea-02u-13 TaxID=2058326 RepID=UPI000C331739|nr:thioredoxin family protein [Psychromonas sp. Urea-02u-13]PKG38046.1 thiol reductase thioredoxin [Psychromonas sp. Urea-02u-13]
MSNHAMTIKPLSATDSLEALLAQHEYSLLFFSASWCGPCQSMTPIVAEVASMMSKRINVIKLDVDTSAKYAEEYAIRSVPTLFVVKNDEIIAQCVGGLAKSKLTQWLTQLTESH